MDKSLLIVLLPTAAFIITLLRHIQLKRELIMLKSDMKQHMLEHGADNQLWIMFVERTRKMLTFWR